jgi:hypothetical protein
MSEAKSLRIKKLHAVGSSIDDAMVLLVLHEVGFYGALVSHLVPSATVAR